MTKNTHTVTFPDAGVAAEVPEGASLLDVIRENGIAIDADCGGLGKCGRCVCLVTRTQDGPEASGAVRSSANEDAGERLLACETRVTGAMTVRVPRGGSGYDILTDSAAFGTRGAGAANTAIAVDIGTTTVVTKLIDARTGAGLYAAAALNDQRTYGADVISRIDESMDDASLLSGIITKQLDAMIAEVLTGGGADASSVRRVVVAGNTTMCYLLLGLPCRSLGLAPFEPRYTFNDQYSYNEVFHTDTLGAPVHVLPFISSFIGGDITAGLLTLCADADTGGSYMLIDMGTNGEIAFQSGSSLICTSTAAGPAFEGVNISCGSGSVTGAVSKVDAIADGSGPDAAGGAGGFSVKTIGGAAPRSVCGSGLLDAMACFVRAGIVDASGKLNAGSPLVSDGKVQIAPGVALTQKDVREFQLAKSAIRAGIEVLIEESGTLPGKVRLAGGFGQHLDPESAFATGLLPVSLRGRVEAIGNSSIAGAAIAAADTARIAEAAAIAAGGREINLAAHPRFNELFMEHMMF